MSPAQPRSEAAAGRLHGLELVIFDKDGTLIEFDAMWGPWLTTLAGSLTSDTGLAVGERLYAAMGFDPLTGRVGTGGALAATPMARLRDLTVEVLVEGGVPPDEARAAVARHWDAPDPVALARPLADLPALFGALHAGGQRVAIATTDDRQPTERTLAALGVAPQVDALVCADDGLPVKPAPDMVRHLCARLGIEPRRAAVIGDSPSDLAMGRAAGAGLVIGVLSGVGERRDLEPLADLLLASIADLARDDS